MNRLEYVDALRVALDGLPPEVVARVVSDIENRFARGLARGMTEEQIADELEHPTVIAQKARDGSSNPVPYGPRSNGDLARSAATAAGLLLLDAILFVPGMVYLCMLAAGFLLSLGMYTGGVVVTATGLAGVNEVSLSRLFHGADVRISGIDELDRDLNVGVSGSGVHVSESSASKDAKDSKDAAIDIVINKPIQSVNHATARDKSPVQIEMQQSGKSNSRHVFQGILLILAGIGSLLICLVVGRYTLIGLGKLVSAQLNALRNA